MTKSRHDRRTLRDVLQELLIQRTDSGDLIKLRVVMDGRKRPSVSIETNSRDEKKKRWNAVEDVTTFLPEEPFYYTKDPVTGKHVGQMQGFASWDKFITQPGGLLELVSGLVTSSGRRFEKEITEAGEENE